MPRQLKPLQIDELDDDRTGECVTIFFDRNDHKFYGCIGGEEYRADTADACKRQLREVFKKYKGTNWEQFIFVDISNPDKEDNYSNWSRKEERAKMEFCFGRVEIAKSPSGKELERPFLGRGKKFGEEAPTERELQKRKTGEDVKQSTVYRRYVRVPYSDDVWRVLGDLKERAEELGRRLYDLIHNRHEELVAMAPKLLPAPRK